MNESDLKRVKLLENKKGNLKFDKYILKIPSNSIYEEYEKIVFNFKYSENSISLEYYDEEWAEAGEGQLPSKDGRKKEDYYNNIINFLINHFNSKYEKVSNNSWQTNNRVIILNSSQDILRLGSPWERPLFVNLHRDEKNKKVRIAECNIEIVYMLKDEYNRRIEKTQSDSKNYEIKRKEIENEIDKSINNL